ncbi:tyrosine-protein phosphatase [Cellulomonas sp. APG4]|uniref:tyrosine-protein phosphatase n=1 Tax=Cellulomonas sp. APG4 TaxID=1538656 RepID=UPI00137AF62A|nr:tyrosine-protein phosphatase [Cellulomonas sp. APG4]
MSSAVTAQVPAWPELPGSRFLGGLPAVHEGRTTTTLPGRLFRSAVPSALSADAWARVSAQVRTVVDLRNPGEGPRYTAPDGVVVHRLPIEDQADQDFMRRYAALLSTPHYYAEVLRRWPHLVAAVIRTIARAPEGGVLVHCAQGRDRTGQVSAMLLSLAGVPHEVVADDYELAVRACNARLREHPVAHDPALDDDELDAVVAEKREVLLAFLADDVAGSLRDAGVDDDDLAAVRARLLVP